MIEKTSKEFMEGFIFQFPDFDDPALNAQQTNFTVLRLRRALLSRGSLGGIFTRRSVSTVGPGSNEVFGLDANVGVKSERGNAHSSMTTPA